MYTFINFPEDESLFLATSPNTKKKKGKKCLEEADVIGPVCNISFTCRYILLFLSYHIPGVLLISENDVHKWRLIAAPERYTTSVTGGHR